MASRAAILCFRGSVNPSKAELKKSAPLETIRNSYRFLNFPEDYYYLKDHLGSNRLIVRNDNGVGVVTAETDYDPFGFEIRTGSPATAEQRKFKFTGKERDVETGLDYFGARYLDSAIGVFRSVDPLDTKYPGWSPYAYALNNPIRNYDPDGRSAATKLAKVVTKVIRTGFKEGFQKAASKAEMADTFADVISDVKTLADPSRSFVEHAAAGISLASEALPVSVGDVKDVGKIVRGALSSSGEAATEIPGKIYRAATKGNLDHVTPRTAKGETAVSFRDSQSVNRQIKMYQKSA